MKVACRSFANYQSHVIWVPPGSPLQGGRESVRCPNGTLMEQVALTLLDAVIGSLVGKRYLIPDRGPAYRRGSFARP